MVDFVEFDDGCALGARQNKPLGLQGASVGCHESTHLLMYEQFLGAARVLLCVPDRVGSNYNQSPVG